MSAKDKCKAEIWPIVQIYIAAKDSFLYSKYLYFASTPSERSYINSNLHFKVIRHYLWQVSVIEIAKLISDRKSDEFRIRKFINKVKKGGPLASLKIPDENIIKWEKAISENEAVIKDVMTLRDKVYAHRDKEAVELKISVSFKQIEPLFTIVEDVIKDIYNIALDSSIILSTPGFESNRFDIIKTLADAREATIKPLVDYLKELEREEAAE